MKRTPLTYNATPSPTSAARRPASVRTSSRFSSLTLALTAALLAGLTACNRSNPDQTAGQKVDAAMATTERKAGEMKADVKEGVANLSAAASENATKAERAVNDAVIKTQINAELAKDPKLSALKIDVDSHEGRVTLTGTAPDPAAKVRATELAAGVTGVSSVDNALQVQ